MANPAGVQRTRSTDAAMWVPFLRSGRERVTGAIQEVPAAAESLYERFMMGLKG
jgi:hypothetical protein